MNQLAKELASGRVLAFEYTRTHSISEEGYTVIERSGRLTAVAGVDVRALAMEILTPIAGHTRGFHYVTGLPSNVGTQEVQFKRIDMEAKSE